MLLNGCGQLSAQSSVSLLFPGWLGPSGPSPQTSPGSSALLPALLNQSLHLSKTPRRGIHVPVLKLVLKCEVGPLAVCPLVASCAFPLGTALLEEQTAGPSAKCV